MRKIPAASFARARTFADQHARPLERAHLKACLAEGTDAVAQAAVIEALKRFQTPEGGFGYGIECDVRGCKPTVYSTSIAFQYLHEVAAPASATVVRDGMDFLMRTVDRDRWVWRAIDDNVNSGPRAPWWHLDDLETRFNNFVFHPTAELLGYLYEYRELAEPVVLANVERRVLAGLRGLARIDDAFDLRCCLRLRDAPGLPEHVRAVLDPILLASLQALDPTNPHFNFMQLIPRPGAFGYDAVAPAIALQSERLIAEQGADGAWRPFWSWADADPAAWRDAEQEWAGVLTCDAIMQFSRHKLVEADG